MYKGKNRCVSGQKHALSNSIERARIWLHTRHQDEAVKPNPVDHELMKPVNTLTHRLFGQISIIQFLHIQLGLEGGNLLANTLETFPHNKIIPFERTGAPDHWQDLPLWAN